MADTPVVHYGPHGDAHHIPATHYQDHPAILAAWLITAPVWHPLWSQYMLAVITLADTPGVPPAVKDHPDNTHELAVLAMNPDRGPYTIDSFAAKTVGYLTPGNIAERFTATDEQAVQLAEMCVWGALEGLLPLETADAPERIRAAWRQSIHRTLDHARDPHHGTQN